MSLLHYIDNEVPAFGEWDSVVTAGSSTIVQSADAAWPERGDVGLRLTTAGAAAYLTKDAPANIAPGGDVYMGYWLRANQLHAGDSVQLCGMLGAADHFGMAYLTHEGQPLIYAKRDAGTLVYAFSSQDLVTDRWYWLVFRLHRAATNVSADGYVQLYIDGQPTAKTADIDNYDVADDLASVILGAAYAYTTGFVGDFDEIKIATTYPEPCSPTPADEYPSASRTVVLFRQGSADSREFADYCVAELGVPRANLCPLPNATANETLANYVTFQAEVEDDLAAWLALNPTAAANCSCFLLGYGVPGYFATPGEDVSAASRLMNYGEAYSYGTANPLYNPATVARLTKADLGGKYLCTRIDADTLANAKAIIDRGATVSALSALAATDMLYSADAAYLASLACQHLRIATAALGEYANDAFVWGDTGAPSFGAAGSRAAFVDDSAGSAVSMRAANSACGAAILTGLYAAAMGNREAADTFDAESFFEMLRIGGTFAEAVAVSVSRLDHSAVPLGSPLMTVAVPQGGYNVYHGVGDAGAIDYATPVAHLRAGQQQAELATPIQASQNYVLAARGVSPAGLEENNSHVLAYAQIDGAGQLLPPPLCQPVDVTAAPQANGCVMGFSYRVDPGCVAADGFDILSDAGTGTLDLQNPVGSLSDVDAHQEDFEIVLSSVTLPALFAVRARSGDQIGPISRTVRAVAAREATPPTLL